MSSLNWKMRLDTSIYSDYMNGDGPLSLLDMLTSWENFISSTERLYLELEIRPDFIPPEKLLNSTLVTFLQDILMHLKRLLKSHQLRLRINGKDISPLSLVMSILNISETARQHGLQVSIELK